MVHVLTQRPSLFLRRDAVLWQHVAILESFSGLSQCHGVDMTGTGIRSGLSRSMAAVSEIFSFAEIFSYPIATL